MKLHTMWIVCDPTPLSELCDICWEQSAETLHFQIAGINAWPGREWKVRHYTIWTTEVEARMDAAARLALRKATYPVVRSDGTTTRVTIPEE